MLFWGPQTSKPSTWNPLSVVKLNLNFTARRGSRDSYLDVVFRGVLTHTCALDRLWGGDETLKWTTLIGNEPRDEL